MKRTAAVMGLLGAAATFFFFGPPRVYGKESVLTLQFMRICEPDEAFRVAKFEAKHGRIEANRLFDYFKKASVCKEENVLHIRKLRLIRFFISDHYVPWRLPTAVFIYEVLYRGETWYGIEEQPFCLLRTCTAQAV